jgi:hypothetical protein
MILQGNEMYQKGLNKLNFKLIIFFLNEVIKFY